jgi:hypothetical protein
MHEITIYDREELQNSTKQFIFGKLLKMGHLVTTLTEEEERVADGIFHDMLLSFCVCLHTFYR